MGPGEVHLPEQVVVCASRKRTAFVILLAVPLVAASALLLVVGDSAFARGVGVVGLLFFGAALLVLAHDLIRGPALVEADSTSVKFRWCPRVPWASVAALRIVDMGGGRPRTRFLGLVPADPDDPLFTGGWLRRVNTRIAGGRSPSLSASCR